MNSSPAMCLPATHRAKNFQAAPTARVIPLPGAAQQPVAQMKRIGRFPSIVTHIREARSGRVRAELLAGLTRRQEMLDLREKVQAAASPNERSSPRCKSWARRPKSTPSFWSVDMAQPKDFHAQLAANREATDAAVRKAFLRQKAPNEAVKLAAPRVSMKLLATRLQMDVSACRRYVLRLGYKPLKQRTPDSNFQLALTVTELEAYDIQMARAKDGYCAPPK